MTNQTQAEDGGSIFETNQIHMAVFFMCRGVQPLGRGRKVGQKVFFQFPRRAQVGDRQLDIDELKLECLVGNDTVSARQYEANFSTLKQLIYDA